MKQKPIIAPSILSADFACLGKEVNAVLKAGADWVHFDVMDNHYVPNLTIGPMVCKALRDHGVKAPIDVHLMAEPVDQLIELFAEAGATNLTIHPEATRHLDRSLKLIHDLGCKAGIALNPHSSIRYLHHVLDKVDLMLIMSVNPGFAGQAFIPESLKKIQNLRKIIDENNLTVRLEVDGGVKTDNIAKISAAGADTFVAGSAIFNTDNYGAIIKEFRGIIT